MAIDCRAIRPLRFCRELGEHAFAGDAAASGIVVIGVHSERWRVGVIQRALVWAEGEAVGNH